MYVTFLSYINQGFPTKPDTTCAIIPALLYGSKITDANVEINDVIGLSNCGLA